MTSVPMPICELCDRLTIARLKLERLPADEVSQQDMLSQVKYYSAGLPKSVPELPSLIEKLYTANAAIWDAEHEIRKGLDDHLGLEEIGRRALRIRELNRVRVQIKNEISTAVSQPEFRDCKMNHVSE